MNNNFIFLLILTSFISCASVSKDPNQKIKTDTSENIEEILNRAEANSTLSGRKILEASRSMISNKEIIVGGCWDYINTVFDRVGYSSKERITFFKSKFQGPYINSDMIRPGDWLYFVNHSYSRTEHSAIFVAWTNQEKKEALMISYVGENQKKPATYKKFELTNIYNVIRARE